MAYCNKCGTQMSDDIKFCPSCGTPNQVREEKIEENKFSKVMDTQDSTSEFKQSDIDNNKAMAVMAYLGILVLIPIIGAKDSAYARFHANQGLILCIAAILYSVAYSVISAIVLAISWRLYFITTILGFVGLVFGVLAIIGIINALNGRAKELPIIGKYKIIK